MERQRAARAARGGGAARSATTATGSSTTGARSTATRRRQARATSTPPPFTHGGRPGHRRRRSRSPTSSRIQKDGWSRYHALQTQGREALLAGRVAAGVLHLVEDGSALGGGLSRTPTTSTREVGRSRNDRPHYFVAQRRLRAALRPRPRDWTRLGRRVTNALLGGWSLSPILTIASGAPLESDGERQPVEHRQPTGPTSSATGSWRTRRRRSGSTRTAFVANDRYTFGNAPRNLLRGPGTFNLDIVLRKSFRLSSRVSADLRFESFNATNALTWATRTRRSATPTSASSRRRARRATTRWRSSSCSESTACQSVARLRRSTRRPRRTRSRAFPPCPPFPLWWRV